MILIIIDGTGHGVSGAFLTMLVKAIKEQVFAKIKEGTLQSSPALILEYFNYSLKMMLHQTKNSQSNSGFDGGVLYYNKQTNLCKYAGAKMPIYIVNNGELKVIKGDRKSVGYSRIKIDQKYTEYEITIHKNSRLYLTTDGIPDQEGKDNMRFGIEEFKKIIVENYHLPFEKQYQILQDSFLDFKDTQLQSDDITAIGLKF